MRIIPVLDLMGGRVVHGIGGMRSNYRPIASEVTDSVQPDKVAKDLMMKFGFSEVYIADLDSIQGVGNHGEEIGAILQLGYTVYLDPGIRNSGDLHEKAGEGVRVIVGTETLESLQELRFICDRHPHVVTSLDYKGGLLAADGSLGALDTGDLVKRVCEKGISELIYLDIKKVGSSSGTTSARMVTVIENSTVPVLVGGGIRNSGDIEHLSGLGVEGVLVATCIHSGALSVEDVARLAAGS